MPLWFPGGSRLPLGCPGGTSPTPEKTRFLHLREVAMHAQVVALERSRSGAVSKPGKVVPVAASFCASARGGWPRARDPDLSATRVGPSIDRFAVSHPKSVIVTTVSTNAIGVLCRASWLLATNALFEASPQAPLRTWKHAPFVPCQGRHLLHLQGGHPRVTCSCYSSQSPQCVFLKE